MFYTIAFVFFAGTLFGIATSVIVISMLVAAKEMDEFMESKIATAADAQAAQAQPPVIG